LVKIERGSLLAPALVVWCDKDRAGLRLDLFVDVDRWVPRGNTRSQSRVDEVVHGFRSEARLPNVEGTLRVAGPGPLQITELASLITELKVAYQSLAEDPGVLLAHSELLQRMDIVTEPVSKLFDVYPKRT
jgi:hypothetical protein